jgi:trk system potassium uptake protein TrkH
VPGIGWFTAYFEAMSAMTATGATALSGLDKLPVSVNVWRCFLQYVGGLGIILLVVAVLPLLGLGGMQLYKAETPGPMKDTKLTPRIAETARGLWTVYFALSVACLLAYGLAGMSWADAFMHMCSTMGLGGFSSHDASFGYWNSPLIEGVAIFFMATSGISFARYFIVWRARSALPLWRDAEVRAYAAVLLVSIAVATAVLVTRDTYGGALQALRFAAFQVVSLATTTGYSSTDYLLWPAFVPVLLIFLGCFVSCAGSTGGGVKMVRMIVLVKQARRELVRIIHPRVVNPVTLGGGTVPSSVIATILGFMLIYGASIVGFTMLLLISGLDLVTAFSAVIVCVNNIGPGLGLVGPANNFGFLNEFQLWVCTAAMLLGRLELLSVLVLFTIQFWRK